MKRSLSSIAALALLSGPALGADMAVKAPYAMPTPIWSWTGFYIGANFGGGGNDTFRHLTGGNALSQTIIDIGLIPDTLRTRPLGFVAGGQLGYNWQVNPSFVLGFETDLQWSNIRGSDARLLTTAPLNAPLLASLATTGSSTLDWYGTARVRVGWLATERFMLYATGGVAYGQVVDNTAIALAVSVRGQPVPGLNTAIGSSSSSTQFGWTVGAGFEYALTQNWFMRTEYQYIDLGSTSGSMGATLINNTPVLFNVSQSHTYNIGKVGLNYKF